MEQSPKGQVSVEFMILVGMVFFAFIVVGIIVSEKNIDINKQKELLLAEDMAKSLQKEIILAKEVQEGYLREFFIPSTLQGYEFLLVNSADQVAVQTQSYSIHKNIPEIVGSFQKGNNTINKTGGVIYVN